MFNNSKYGNLLTVILIVSVVAIIGIIGIIGYRIYNAYYIDKGATQAATQFEQSISNNQNNIDSNNTKIDITGGIEEDFNNITTQNNTMYKGYKVVGTIQIPKINLKYPILEKLTAKSLKTSVVLLYTSKGLNNEGNSVIIGHNFRNGTMFSNVNKLSNGDIIYITDMTGRKVKYIIYNIYRASGSDGEYITRDTKGKREISLSTCTDDSKARTIVLAKES